MGYVVNSLCWSNINRDIIDYHQKVMRYFDINITYHNINMDHGSWMDKVILESKEDIVIFCDIDCVILNRKIFDDAIQYVQKAESFIGPAQVSNHIKPAKHIFSAPSFFFITRKCYSHLGNPSFRLSEEYDVAENVSYVAESLHHSYKYWYPKRYEKNRTVYRLGNYGYFGTGTVYEDSIYHLYDSHKNRHTDLFKYRCNQILNNNFDFSDMEYSVKIKEKFFPFL